MEVRYPPFKGVSQRYLRDTLSKQGKARAIPPSAILSRKGIARYGGVSRTGPLSSLMGCFQMCRLFWGEEGRVSRVLGVMPAKHTARDHRETMSPGWVKTR